jgi:hypothetical protein
LALATSPELFISLLYIPVLQSQKLTIASQGDVEIPQDMAQSNLFMAPVSDDSEVMSWGYGLSLRFYRTEKGPLLKSDYQIDGVLLSSYRP